MTTVKKLILEMLDEGGGRAAMSDIVRGVEVHGYARKSVTNAAYILDREGLVRVKNGRIIALKKLIDRGYMPLKKYDKNTIPKIVAVESENDDEIDENDYDPIHRKIVPQTKWAGSPKPPIYARSVFDFCGKISFEPFTPKKPPPTNHMYTRRNIKKIQALNLHTGEVIKTYESIADACREDGYKSACVNRVCQGHFAQHRGVKFRYVDAGAKQ